VPNDDEERPVAIGKRALDHVTDPAVTTAARGLDESPTVDLLLEVQSLASAPSDLRKLIRMKQIFLSPLVLADIDEGTRILRTYEACEV
jgi:hypothetical protein